MATKEEKAEKKKLKAKKKLLKAQYELEKKKVEAGHHNKKEECWYRNPDWIRAIVAVITLIITVLLIFFGLRA